MKKYMLTAAAALLAIASFAQDAGKTYNRYGMALEKDGNGWKVKNEAGLVKRFGFDPDTVACWNEPWHYTPDRISKADMEKCTINSFTYKKYPDHECVMDVYLPKDQGSGPFPFMMFIHGGGWRTGHEKTPNMVLPAKWFASNGIAVMSVSYTLASQGDFEDTKADLRDALKYIAGHAKEWSIDASRFGFYGFSAGGHLSSYMGMTTPQAKLFISSAGPADMTVHGKQWFSKRSGLADYFGVESEDSDNLRKASPLYLIPDSPDKIPAAMIIQGMMDGIVDPEPCLEFAEALKEHGAEVEVLAVPYGPHGVVNPRFYRYEEFMFDMLDFARKYL